MLLEGPRCAFSARKCSSALAVPGKCGIVTPSAANPAVAAIVRSDSDPLSLDRDRSAPASRDEY